MLYCFKILFRFRFSGIRLCFFRRSERSGDGGGAPAGAGQSPAGERQISVELEGSGIELIISALFGDKLLVVAAFDDAALFEYHDNIGVLDG